jgi:septal ring factor EnvC (AmiA/AmiB activator)
MHPIGTMFLGAAGLAAAALAGLRRRKLEADVAALTRRVDELTARTAGIPKLQAQTDRNTQALHEIQAAVSRMEQGFTLLGDRLATQNEILEGLQISHTVKEEKLQLTLRAVIEAVNDIRRARTPTPV